MEEVPKKSRFGNLRLKLNYFWKLNFERENYDFIPQEKAVPVGPKMYICHFSKPKKARKTCKKLLLNKVFFEGLKADGMFLVDRENVGKKRTLSVVQPCQKIKN
jgi:hypothetical protein